jgi:hypothetical protein
MEGVGKFLLAELQSATYEADLWNAQHSRQVLLAYRLSVGHDGGVALSGSHRIGAAPSRALGATMRPSSRYPRTKTEASKQRYRGLTASPLMNNTWDINPLRREPPPDSIVRAHYE